MENRTPPISVGEEYGLEIESIGSKGDPILKIDKYIIFLKAENHSLMSGDRVKVRITKVLPDYGFACLCE